jgi:hypothetical protein
VAGGRLPGAAEQKVGILPARFCGRSRADLLLARQSATLLPSCVRPKRSWLLEQLLQILDMATHLQHGPKETDT